MAYLAGQDPLAISLDKFIIDGMIGLVSNDEAVSMAAGPMMNFDRPKVERLRAALTEAKALDQQQFVFDGHDLVTAYAKYMLDYLDSKLAPATTKVS
jgi:hypothetical protein